MRRLGAVVRRARSARVFRVLLAAHDLEASRRFYETLLASPGRQVAPGRVYFDCGPVLVGLLDYGPRGRRSSPTPVEALYFATSELEKIYQRARRLRALAPGYLHGDRSSPMGGIVRRPWGERSFYARDPSGNPLCFVDERTRFTGTAAQVAALERSTGAARSNRRPTPRRAASRRP